jgi:hypothetical protein
MSMKLLEITSVGFDVTDQLLIRFSAFVRYWKKWKYNETVHELFIDFNKVYASVWGKYCTIFSKSLGYP